MKYRNNIRKTEDGTFHSDGEYRRWIELKWMQRAGKISDLKRQVRYELIPSQKGETRTERKVVYVADFVYVQNGKTIVEDFKGKKTTDYILKRKLMLYKYGIEILETQ